MIGQTISHYELTSTSRVVDLWSLSKFREGRTGSASASPSLILEKGAGGDEFAGEQNL